MYVVTELSLNLSAPPPIGEMHPETTPVGPFNDREAADAWARTHCEQYGGGSWTTSPVTAPTQARGASGEGAADE